MIPSIVTQFSLTQKGKTSPPFINNDSATKKLY